MVEPSAVLEIGNNFGCTGDTRISASHHMIIGNDNLWSYGCVIMDSDSHSIYNEHREVINKPRSVIIGDHVWVGCNSIILKGTVIPSNTVVAAGSRLSQVVATEDAIITTGGKVLKTNIRWDGKAPLA